ncbi:hypothetical protein CGLO_13693 [Colletotrichum gloeosporioides Cg-14]|uniref:Uncharacterized protein n=1 Tax=Colletotrichum gloeosporioides (strain Cg-14) TaxID=1237896 RepID=T0K350_COLGC|nr:hypothetical protein CGLO_13693 [Colletotrichum gloeosporioides Cg-14]
MARSRTSGKADEEVMVIATKDWTSRGKPFVNIADMTS